MLTRHASPSYSEIKCIVTMDCLNPSSATETRYPWESSGATRSKFLEQSCLHIPHTTLRPTDKPKSSIEKLKKWSELSSTTIKATGTKTWSTQKSHTTLLSTVQPFSRRFSWIKVYTRRISPCTLFHARILLYPLFSMRYRTPLNLHKKKSEKATSPPQFYHLWPSMAVNKELVARRRIG